MENKMTNVSKKIKIVWIITRIFALLPNLIFLLIGLLVTDMPFIVRLLIVIYACIALTIVLIWLIILPNLQYKRYLYLIKDDEIIIMRGVIFKETIVIPLVQIQDIGYIQGPFDQILKLATVVISTSGSTKMIGGLEVTKAKEIVDNVKEKVKEYVKKRDEGRK